MPRDAHARTRLLGFARPSVRVTHTHIEKVKTVRDGDALTYARREGRVDGIETSVYTPTVHDPRMYSRTTERDGRRGDA